jgi:hypothetical protein
MSLGATKDARSTEVDRLAQRLHGVALPPLDLVQHRSE